MPSVEGTVVCASAAADGSMGLDGLPFGADTLLADGALYGSVPVLLSRTGADGSFFHTAASFYYYPPPHSFGVAAPIYPGGGPLGMSTNISLAAGGLRAFDGRADNVRVRWGEAATDEDRANVTTPHALTDANLSVASYQRDHEGDDVL